MASREVIEYLFKGNPTDLLQATKKVKGGMDDVGKGADKAAAEVNQSFSRMASGMQKAGQKMQSAGKALTVGVTLPLAYALKGMADAAIEDQAALAKLEGQLQRTTGATRAQLDEVNEFIDKTAIAKGVADDQLRPAFERLARASGDTTQAQKDLNLALDVSRATGKDVDAVAQAIGRAYDGSTGALGRLGIATKDAEGNTLSLKTIMEDMNRQFGGAADDWANTAAGRAEIARIKFDELQEQLGGALVPVMEDLVQVAGWVIDKFTAMPDWLQKTSVALLMLKGPISWIGGIGARLIGDYLAKLIATKAAADTAAGAVSGMASAAGGAAGGGLAALGAGAGSTATALGFKAGLGAAAVNLARFLGQGLGLSTVVTYMGPAIVASDQLGSAFGRLEEDGWTLGGSFKEIGGVFADALEFITGPGVLRGIASVSDRLLGWVGINSDFKSSLENLFPSLKNVLGLTAGEDGGGEPGDAAYRWATGFQFFNDIIAQSPANIDPMRQKLEEMAKASGWSTDELEALTAQLETFNEEIGFISGTLDAERAMRALGDAIVELKTTQSDAEATAQDQQRALEGVEDAAVRASDTMVNQYITAVQNGRMSDEEATRKKEELLAALGRTKAEVPQVSGVIDGLAAAVNGVPTRREIKFEIVGVQDVLRGIDSMRQAFANLPRSGVSTVPIGQAFRGGARAALRAAGGTMGFAAGGVYPQNSGGGITDKMTYVIGEGRNPREYVIPTDPQYSQRAQSLLAMASAELGVPRQQVSSTFAPVINVSGGSDPDATAAAVADAVEQAFARKKRREGSLAFS